MTTANKAHKLLVINFNDHSDKHQMVCSVLRISIVKKHLTYQCMKARLCTNTKYVKALVRFKQLAWME